MADPRNARTEASIKSALLRLMEQKPSALVGVAELAREASVSSSTFYNHYAGVYDVFSSLVDDFDAGNLSFSNGVRCSDDASRLEPFCMRLRDAGAYAPLVTDPGFLPELIKRTNRNRRALGGMAVDAGLAEQQAQSLDTFQIAGCYAAAMSLPREADWEPSRHAIDHLLRARISSLGDKQMR